MDNKEKKYINLNKRFYFIAILFILIFIQSFYLNQKTSKINIFYTSDGKSIFYDLDEYDKVYGLITFADYLKNSQYKDYLLVDVGNTIYKTPETLNDNGLHFINLMSKMKYDALCIGESELSWGGNTLSYLSEKAEFPFLSCNIKQKNEFQNNIFVPYTIKTVQGLKIGIIGLTNKDVFKNNLEKNVKDYSIKPLFQTLKKYIQILRDEEKVDLVILLSRYTTHTVQENSYLINNIVIANEIKGIDIILGRASTNETTSDGYISSNNKTIICNTLPEFKSIGHLEIIVRNKTKKIVSFVNEHLKTSMPLNYLKDKKFLYYENIQNFEKQKEDKYSTILGRSDFYLTNDVSEISSMSRLIADLMKEKTGADFAIIKNNDIRSAIAKGKIKYHKIFEVFPEPQKLVTIQLKGKDLLDILEFGIHNKQSDFVTISDLDYIYDKNLPLYSKIIEIFSYNNVDNNIQLELELEKTYKVVVLEGMLSTYLDQDVYRKAANIEILNINIQDLLLNFLSTHVPIDSKYNVSDFKKQRKNRKILYKK